MRIHSFLTLSFLLLGTGSFCLGSPFLSAPPASEEQRVPLELPGEAPVRGNTLRCRIYFRLNSSELELSYRNNGARLDSLLQDICSLKEKAVLRRVFLHSSASPDGSSALNSDLSRKRGTSLHTHLQEQLALPDSVFALSSFGANWERLEELVSVSDAPYRTEVLRILRETPEWVIREGKVVDSRKRQLMRLHGGRTWRDMLERFFPELRNSSVMECEFEPIVRNLHPAGAQQDTRPADTVILRDTLILRDTVETEVVRYDTVQAPVPDSDSLRPFFMALKTNLLYDAALVPNLGLEFYLGKGWAVGGSWMYGWWSRDSRHRYWRIYGGEIDLRKYFGRRAAEKPLTGHHIGLYGLMVTYDFETGGRGIMGGHPGGTIWDKANYGGGLEYGYALPVGKRLNLDFGIGLGYLGGTYYEYIPSEGRYAWQATKKRNWFGPTKAEVSLVWLLGRGNCNAKKGGKK